MPGPVTTVVVISRRWQGPLKRKIVPEEQRDISSSIRLSPALCASYASILARAGLSLPVIGALLGHTQPNTTARYSHLFDDPLRQATERVGAVVTAAGSGKTAEVVKLRNSGGAA